MYPARSTFPSALWIEAWAACSLPPVKIREMIKSLFRRQPPLPREELAAPTDEERRREHEADLTAEIEAEKLRSMMDGPRGRFP